MFKTLIFSFLFILHINMNVAAQDNLIPREVIFANPDKSSITISPDGKFIAYLANNNSGITNIFVSRIDQIEHPNMITNEEKRGVRGYFWSYNEQNILYIKDNGGDENYSISSINIHSLKEKLLTPDNGVKAVVYKVSPKFPDEIMIGLNSRKKEFFDVYKLNTSTGELKLFYKNDSYIDFDIDDDYNIRFGSLVLQNGNISINKFAKNYTETKFWEIKYEDTNTSGILDFSKSGQKVYVLDSDGRDTSGLYVLDLSDNSKELIYSNYKTDISDVILNPKSKEIEAIIYEYEKENIHIINEDFKKSYNYLKKSSESASDINIVSRTLEDDKWIVAFISDIEPVRYYLYDNIENTLQFLFSNNKKLENYKLNPMKPVIIKSRDGLDLVSYLTLPDNNKLVSPMVLLVHGGPHSRDSWGLDRQHQWLSNRGYAVLSVNYRGSTGLGKNFTNAGDGEWSGKMHDDLIDAVNWAIDNKIADKNKIAIMGGSYGGYATLVGLSFTPEVFACGIDIVGPSNLITLMESVPEYWRPLMEKMKFMVGGDHNTDEGREILRKKSPLFYADQIKKPLLIGHGKNDPRVKLAESDRIVEELKKQDVPVVYAVYPDEGHGFAKQSNRMSFYAISEVFLNKCLGGVYQEITNLENSSVDIKFGKDYISEFMDYKK